MVLPENGRKQKGHPMFESFKHTAEYKRLQTALQTPGAAALFGMPPVAHARILSELAADGGRSLLVVTPGEAEATRFAQDLEALGMPAAVFPPRDFLLRPIEGAGREYEYRRLAVLGDLVGGRLRAVCVPAEALLQYTVPKAEFCANTLTLKPGMTIPVKELAARLLAAGYHRRSQVEGPGQFSVRGGIVDVFPPDSKAPARAEFWGDEIDTLNSFDILSQRRDDALEKVYISPAREVLFGDAAETAAALRSALAAQKGRRASAMEKAMEADLAQLDAGLVPEALDKYLGIRYPKPATLLDYFDNAILVLEEPSAIREAHKATQFRRTEEMKGLFEEGLLCPGLDVLYQDLPDLMHAVDSMPSLCCENFARTMPEVKLKDIVNAPAHAHPPFSGEVAALAEDLEPLTKQGYVVELLAGTSRAAAALAKDLAAKGFAATAAKDVLPGPGVVAVRPGHLTGGAEFPFAKYALFTSRKAGSADTAKKPAKKKNKDALSSLTDIKPGDYVVHQNHGIGMYTGIQRLEVQGVVKDYLKISYDKGDTLYVPVTQLDLLSRYTAPGDSDKVKLAKLGGTEWAKTRRRVKTAAAEMAQELIELYAKRRQAKGFAFPEDSDWQRDFETRFEYDETGDQLTAAAEIKKDMEKPWPMDRLLCGDVGVGKTEVALRAAFKCIMGGKQCAILAPTTLLAWQHYNGLLARMEAFPVKAGLLSRFRTPTQQKNTLRGLKEGTVDVVVGTHRLLSDDVKFKDLGLVIIDEEQRFGVKHKEKLKEAFIGVDMLTLSATPIPRTLNMAMSGIRDMSTIEEPPVERQPIETYVMEYDRTIVAEAIKKELARGGQVYYLHNRVDSIDACAGMVGQMVPGARIATAHGKMTEEQLSKVWQQLLDGEIDVLVCTTLIETGVDVRNCNTLIIEDSDKMGLAQLYQIRGRVGRSGRKAYAYFTFQRDRVLTDVAAKRLSAIREFTSFGSGFRIAMRDLQIRGAGSLLGQSQHGHMEAVGYDLYVKILNNAIAMAKGEELQPDKSECLIDITVDAYIPERYIAEAAGRIEAYKRIAAIETEEDAQDVLDELIDRYGDVPASVAGLVDISLVRVSAARAGIYEIGQKRDALILYSDTLNAQRIKLAVAALPGRITVNSSAKPYLAVRVASGEKPLDILKQALNALGPVQENTSGTEKV